jgi:hypothetical protein
MHGRKNQRHCHHKWKPLLISESRDENNKMYSQDYEQCPNCKLVRAAY